MAMEFQLHMGDDDPEGGENPEQGNEMASLYRWLSQDPDLRSPRTVLRLDGGGPRPGQMGVTADAINVVVANAISFGSLVVSYRAWRDTRPRPRSAHIEVDGVTVNLDDATPDEIERVIVVLRDQPETEA